MDKFWIGLIVVGVSFWIIVMAWGVSKAIASGWFQSKRYFRRKDQNGL